MTSPSWIPPADALLGWRQPLRRDASTVMGMQTRSAYVLVVILVAACTALGLAGGGLVRPGLYVLAMLIALITGLVLLAAPGDPMNWRATAVTATLPCSGLVLVAYATDIPVAMAFAPPTGLLALIQAFMCVRDRLWSAWLSFLLSVGVIVALNALYTDQPAMMAAIAPNTAVLLMATFFAAIVRPRARQIYTLRKQAERQITAAAAEEAAVAVRAQQLDYLDRRARPLLNRIASGEQSGDIVVDSGLVEAELRDRIRAPGLDVPALAAAAWDARSRGVRVVLLDDHGWGGGTLSSADSVAQAVDLLAPLHGAAVRALSAADAGDSITVRVLPAGRHLLGTVAVEQSSGRQRLEFGADGALVAEFRGL